MREALKAARLATMATLIIVAAGCNKEAAATSASRSGEPASADFPEVLATIGNEKITFADIEAKSGDQLAQIETQYKRGRSKIVGDALQALLYERVMDAEAKKQGKSFDELVIAEAGGTVEPSEIEISTWFNENRARMGGRSLEELRPQIADLLRGQKRKAAQEKLQQRLDKERNVVVAYEPYRLKFNNGDAPQLGNPKAKVELVEFSDFQCPFCRSFAPTLRQLERNFGDKIHIVYRQYPLTSIHPLAYKAAEASLCAKDQGKFWELHDMMFAEQDRIATADLKDKARRLGMDQKKFDLCLDSGHYAELVQKELAEGTRVGVTGTPAIYINGIPMDGGAVPYDAIAAVLQKEIDKAGSPPK